MAFLAAIPAAISAIAAGSAATAGAASAAALTLGETSLAVGAVGAGVGAYSAYQSNQFQAAVAKNNAAIATQNSDIAQEQGAQQESISKGQTTQRVGAELAAQGANGVDVGYGSPAAVREGTQEMGNFDAQNVRYNALMRSLGFNEQANSDLVNAKESEAASYTGAASSLIQGTGSFLSSGASLASKWASIQSGQMAKPW